MVTLTLKETLTDKEIKQFKIPNTLQISSFHGMQYCMCIGAVYKDNNKKYQYLPEYSMGYINTDITPNKLISFCELHKNTVIKDRVYINRHFADIYYVVYEKAEKLMLINDFNSFSKNRVDVELTFCDNGYYRVSPYTSVLNGVTQLFSNENINGIPFISLRDNYYYIIYYDNYGKEKEYKYESLSAIYNCITNVRLVGCEKID